MLIKWLSDNHDLATYECIIKEIEEKPEIEYCVEFTSASSEYRILPIKWDPILAKTSRFFVEFLSEIPFWFSFVLLGNSV